MSADPEIGKNLNHKVEKPIFMRLRGPKALDDKGHEGTQRWIGESGKRDIGKSAELGIITTEAAEERRGRSGNKVENRRNLFWG
jgi:hypothetical protein